MQPLSHLQERLERNRGASATVAEVLARDFDFAQRVLAVERTGGTTDAIRYRRTSAAEDLHGARRSVHVDLVQHRGPVGASLFQPRHEPLTDSIAGLALLHEQQLLIVRLCCVGVRLGHMHVHCQPVVQVLEGTLA